MLFHLPFVERNGSCITHAWTNLYLPPPRWYLLASIARSGQNLRPCFETQRESWRAYNIGWAWPEGRGKIETRGLLSRGIYKGGSERVSNLDVKRREVNEDLSAWGRLYRSSRGEIVTMENIRVDLTEAGFKREVRWLIENWFMKRIDSN